MDSLSKPSQSALQYAQRLVTNVKLSALCEQIKPCNKDFQPDGWSCGFQCLKWLETRLRALRGEPRQKNQSLQDVMKFTNEFINKLVPKAKAKAKASEEKPAVKPFKGPRFNSLDEALEAAHKCGKCEVTMIGSKGCTTCMGEWFEHIRQKKASKKFQAMMAARAADKEQAIARTVGQSS